MVALLFADGAWGLLEADAASGLALAFALMLLLNTDDAGRPLTRGWFGDVP
jgi:hypothetical protein